MSVHLKDYIFKKPPKNGQYYTIAIDGRGGSGKTTFLQYVATLLPDFIMINGDDYFEPSENTIAWGEFNDERFEKDVIMPLKRGDTNLLYRPYDWHAKPSLTDKKLQITKGICIERSFSFAFDLDWDCKIWVETPAKIALQRGQERDQMPLEQGYRAWKEVWQPREDTHIQKINPLKTSDIVIDGTTDFKSQIN